MRKSIITFAILGLVSITSGFSQTSARSAMPQELKEVSRQGNNIEAEGNWVPSEEVNTVQISDAAQEMITNEQDEIKAEKELKAAKTESDRKAKQKEKALNAKENDEHGFAITLIAMGIVIFALLVLSILFYGFGKVSASIQKARKRKAHGVTEDEAEDHHEELDSGEVIAAISMALAEHSGQGHDIEDTILTIRRMRKAYSPWNSKIYNMRLMPEHVKASPAKGQK